MIVRSGALALLTLVFQHGAVAHVVVTNNARTWRDVTPRMLLPEVEDALFADAAHGWIVTNDCAAGKAKLERTTNGGRTWKSRPFISASCAAGAGTTLDFLNRRVGWAIHAEPTAPFESLYRTRNGGVTWRLVRRRLPTVGPVAFRSKWEGWLGGFRLYRTKDAGRSWLRVRLRIPRGSGDEDFGAASFYGSRGLLAAAFLRGATFLVWVYSSDDGGHRWAVRARFRARTGPEWPGMRVSSPEQGVVWITAATLKPKLYVTTDAGRHWSRRPFRFRAVGKLVALDTSAAIVQTLDGRTFVTHDRGANWRRVTLPT